MTAIANTSYTLAAALAPAGTFNVNYPSGFTQASFLGSLDGSVAVDTNDVYKQGNPGFGFTFNAGNITITNNTTQTFAINAVFIISFGTNTFKGSYESGLKVSGILPLTAATGVSSDTVVDVTAAFAQATLNNNFKAVSDKVNAIVAALKTAGITV